MPPIDLYSLQENYSPHPPVLLGPSKDKMRSPRLKTKSLRIQTTNKIDLTWLNKSKSAFLI